MPVYWSSEQFGLAEPLSLSKWFCQKIVVCCNFISQTKVCRCEVDSPPLGSEDPDAEGLLHFSCRTPLGLHTKEALITTLTNKESNVQGLDFSSSLHVHFHNAIQRAAS